MRKHLITLYICVLTVSFSHNTNAEYFDSEGVKIFYTDSKGVGETIVLVHGHNGSSDTWKDAGISTELEKKYRVITVDCRGHGKSDKPEKPSDYGPKVGKDIINLLDHLEIKQSHLVGYSMGAFVVGRLLVSNPERVQTAIMGSGFFPTSDKAELDYQQQVAKEMEEQGQPIMAAVARGWRYDAVTDEQISQINTPVQAVFGSEEIDDFFNQQKHRLRLPKSSLPTVIIEGADHFSANAAVFHPSFLEAVENIIRLNSENP